MRVTLAARSQRGAGACRLLYAALSPTASSCRSQRAAVASSPRRRAVTGRLGHDLVAGSASVAVFRRFAAFFIAGAEGLEALAPDRTCCDTQRHSTTKTPLTRGFSSLRRDTLRHAATRQDRRFWSGFGQDLVTAAAS